jgi:hypothetical protein
MVDFFTLGPGFFETPAIISRHISNRNNAADTGASLVIFDGFERISFTGTRRRASWHNVKEQLDVRQNS